MTLRIAPSGAVALRDQRPPPHESHSAAPPKLRPRARYAPRARRLRDAPDRSIGEPVKILLLCSSFNGLTQRVWIELRRAGHDVSWTVMDTDDVLRATVDAVDPDLVLCPFLRERVPDDVWSTRRTVILHPGPLGDRGPSSLDWAISDGEQEWGVTALSAIAEMDAGPVWGTRSFPLPAAPLRKSALYTGLVTDAAVELALEVAEKAAQPDFVPEPLDHAGAPGRQRPVMTQADRTFSWSDPTEHIL